jgi:hypothetical protein
MNPRGAQVRSQVRSCEICDGRNGIGAEFLQVYLGFPCEFSFHQQFPTLQPLNHPKLDSVYIDSVIK